MYRTTVLSGLSCIAVEKTNDRLSVTVRVKCTCCVLQCDKSQEDSTYYLYTSYLRYVKRTTHNKTAFKIWRLAYIDKQA